MHARKGAVLVVGGTGHIGQAIIIEFASRGYPVLFTGRRDGGDALAQELVTKASSSSSQGSASSTPVIKFFHAKVEDADAHEQAVSQAAEMGGADGLGHAINVAGIIFEGEGVPNMWNTPDSTWQRMMEVNIMGTIRACTAQMKQFEKQGVPQSHDDAVPYSIVNTGSIFGHRGLPLGSSYGMTKAAVISLTKSLGQEAYRYGVRVNSISPGFHMQETLQALPAEYLATRLGPTGHGGDFSALAKSYYHLSVEAKYAVGSDMEVDGGWLSAGPGMGLDEWIGKQTAGQ